MEPKARELVDEVVKAAVDAQLGEVPDSIVAHVWGRLTEFGLKPTDEVLVSGLQVLAETIQACRVFAETETCQGLSGVAALGLMRNTLLVQATVLARTLDRRPQTGVSSPNGIDDRSYL